MRGVLVGMFALMALAPAALAQRGEERDDNPRLRMEDFYWRRAFPFDRIPEGALQRARAQVRGISLSLFSAAAPPPIGGTQWQALGPTSIPINGTSIGRIATVAVDPTNSNIVYVGGAQGGVWKTVDGGANWVPLTDKQCALAMGSIAIDPVDPDIIYAGTGEQNFSADSYWGCGILRSIDGGTSWTAIGPAGLQSTSNWSQISRVVIAPTTAGTPATTTLLVAAGAFYSTSIRGLYRSTNGGANWNQTLSGSVTDLVLDPTNDSIGYAAVSGQSVFKTTDRGATWTAVASGFPTSNVGRINIGIAPSAPATLYAGVHNASNSQLLGIWKTTTGGTSWTQLSASGASCGAQCWYDMFIGVSPTNPDTVYFGGVSLYRSANGGASFADITGSIHVDQHAIAFDPQDPATFYVGNDGGVYRSSTAGNSWTSLNAGLALTQFYEGISLHPSDETIVLGGTQDNGTLQYTGAPAWSYVIGGDGGYTAIDQENPLTRYGETQWAPSSGYSGPRRSDGGGYNLKANGIALSDTAQFIPPLVMDPSHPTTLYFATRRIYKTINRADSWTAISGNLTSGTISAVAPAPSNAQVVYVGASAGQLYVTSDGGTNWNLRTTGLSTRYVEDFAVDRADWQTAYVTLSGFGSGHVYRTTNAGQTWTDVSSNLPDIPVNAVIVDPASRGIVMVGTDVGVFISSDSGATWTPLDQGLPNVAVFDIAYNPATGSLIAATHGRGMFALQLDRPLTLVLIASQVADSALLGATDARSDSATVVLSGPGASTTGWSATHTSAAWVTLQNASGTGTGTFTWTRDPTGLGIGAHVDTITVTAAGALDSPWLLFDSLVVYKKVAFAPELVSKTGVSASGSPLPDSAQLLLDGGNDLVTAWTLTHSAASWLSLGTSGGTGTRFVSWTRSAHDLKPGTYTDTIRVVTANADSALLVDTFIVQAPAVATDCAVQHLFGTACLDDTQLRFLDLAGNKDGTFNLGDFLARLKRGAAASLAKGGSQ